MRRTPPARFAKPFARIYVILHGGTRTELEAHLRVLGVPPLQAGADLPVNPPSRLRVIWNPQGYPGPNVELLVYNAGKPGSASDLGSRPRSRAAYSASITPLGR